jgi:hypothetical protein
MNNSILTHNVGGNVALRYQSPRPDQGYQHPLIWSGASPQLATWAATRLVNRRDAWGAYIDPRSRIPGKSNSYTAPGLDQRRDDALTGDILFRHFCGSSQGDLIGLHAISPTNFSRWFVIDIDKHADTDGATPDGNFRAAIEWWQRLRDLGFTPLLLDSNGAGGFHLLQVFNEPCASTAVHSFAQWLVRDFQQRGLCHAPETFPKQACLNERRKYGNFWRLPGRHHTRDHWTRVWNGAAWLEGHFAIQAILSTHGDPVHLIPAEAALWTQRLEEEKRRAAPTSAVSISGASEWIQILHGKREGERHQALIRLAGHFLGRGHSPAEVEEVCVLWNVRNVPPLPEDEVRATVQDIASRHRPRLINSSQDFTLRIQQ